MKFELWRGVNRQWRWRFKGANGEIVATSEGYSRKIDCYNAVMLLKQCANAPIMMLTKGGRAR